MAAFKIGAHTCTITRRFDHPSEECGACGAPERISITEKLSIDDDDNAVKHKVCLDGFEVYPWEEHRPKLPKMLQTVDEAKQALLEHVRKLERKLELAKQFLQTLDNCNKFYSMFKPDRPTLPGPPS